MQVVVESAASELEAAQVVARRHADTARDVLGHDVLPPDARQGLMGHLDAYRQAWEHRLDLILAVLALILKLKDAVAALLADGYPDPIPLVLPRREYDALAAEATDLDELVASAVANDPATTLTGTFGTPRPKTKT